MKRTLTIVLVLVVVILLVGVFAPWDSTNGPSLAPLRTVKTVECLLGAALSQDTRRAVTYGSPAHIITVWDLETGLNTLAIKDTFVLNNPAPLFRFSPDGSTIARLAFFTSSLSDGEIRLYSSETGEIKQRIPLKQRGLIDSVFSPSGDRLAMMTNDQHGGTPRFLMKIWDLEKEAFIQSFSVKGGNRLRFSPDGQFILIGSWIGWPGDDEVDAAQLWNVKSGNLVQEFKGTRGDSFSLAFSPVGSKIATGGGGGDVRLWDVASGKMIDHLVAYPGESRRVNPLAFSSDGTTLAAAYSSKKYLLGTSLWGRVRTKVGNAFPFLAPEIDHNKRIVLWDVRTGTRFRTYNSLGQIVWDMKFTPDGSQLLTIDIRGTVRWWDASGS